MTRGGAGRGQGRNKVIPDSLARFNIGMRCEEIQRERDEVAFRIYQDRQRTQLKIEAQLLARERKVWKTKDEVAKGIDDEKDLYKKSPARLVNLAKFRPRRLTRNEICQIVADELRARGSRISRNKVSDCWREYRKSTKDVGR